MEDDYRYGSEVTTLMTDEPSVGEDGIRINGAAPNNFSYTPFDVSFTDAHGFTIKDSKVKVDLRKDKGSVVSVPGPRQFLVEKFVKASSVGGQIVETWEPIGVLHSAQEARQVEMYSELLTLNGMPVSPPRKWLRVKEIPNLARSDT